MTGADNKVVTIAQGSVGNREYTANYIPEPYPITYNLNGGTASNTPYYNIYSVSLVLNNPTKENYYFVGWEGTGIPEGTASRTVVIPTGSTGPRNYVASYSPCYSITYNLNGGSISVANPTSYHFYSDEIILNNPTKAGYDFVGWTEGTATFPLMLGKIPQSSTGEKNFTANWVESLTFTLPGGVPLILNKCPAGTFIMGSPEDEIGRSIYYYENEVQHQVTLTKDFYIGKYEVTQEQYEAVTGVNPSWNNVLENSNLRPVDDVSWTDAKNFCDWLNANIASSSLPSGYYFKLPTEAQWEYACRAGTTSSLNNGTNVSVTGAEDDPNLNLLGWYQQNVDFNSNPVGQKQSNAWGLYDMHGNISEWCYDWCRYNYYDICGDCIDPQGPDTPQIATEPERITRGGQWKSNANRCRSASRVGSRFDFGDYIQGFRVALVHD